jgi:hypothetical protein
MDFFEFYVEDDSLLFLQVFECKGTVGIKGSKNFEHLVDSSIENPEKIDIKSSDSKFKYYKHEIKKGVLYVAINNEIDGVSYYQISA